MGRRRHHHLLSWRDDSVSSRPGTRISRVGVKHWCQLVYIYIRVLLGRFDFNLAWRAVIFRELPRLTSYSLLEIVPFLNGGRREGKL